MALTTVPPCQLTSVLHTSVAHQDVSAVWNSDACSLSLCCPPPRQNNLEPRVVGQQTNTRSTLCGGCRAISGWGRGSSSLARRRHNKGPLCCEGGACLSVRVESTAALVMTFNYGFCFSFAFAVKSVAEVHKVKSTMCPDPFCGFLTACLATPLACAQTQHSPE